MLVAAACEADATTMAAEAAVRVRRIGVVQWLMLALILLVTVVAGSGLLLLISSSSCSRLGCIPSVGLSALARDTATTIPP